MDIKNLSNQNGNLNGTSPADKNQKSTVPVSDKARNEYADKVSLENFQFRNDEQLFAKVELEKMSRNSFEKLKALNAKISEYEHARQSSPELADQTEIGKMLKNPKVLEKIAQKIAES